MNPIVKALLQALSTELEANPNLIGELVSFVFAEIQKAIAAAAVPPTGCTASQIVFTTGVPVSQ
jgi:hypothetical protein